MQERVTVGRNEIGGGKSGKSGNSGDSGNWLGILGISSFHLKTVKALRILALSILRGVIKFGKLFDCVK